MKRIRAITLFVVIALGVAYPPLATYYRQGMAAPFRYFAADTFYYLSIADHSSGRPDYSFDGIFPTNGFHPLWQYLLTAAFGHIDGSARQERQILLTFFSSIALTAIGAGLCGIALLRLTGSFALALGGMLPGAYWLLFSHIGPHYGAIWSYVNGMESPLSIALFGLLLVLLINFRLLLTPSRVTIVAASSVMTLMTLSRLDDVFIFIPFLFHLLRFSHKGERTLNLIAGCAAPFLAIGGYMLYNLGYAGLPLPISGLSKGGLALAAGMHDLIGALLPARPFANGELWEDLTWRALQGAAPVAIAALWLLIVAKERRDAGGSVFTERHHMHRMLGLLSAYVVMKGAYNFINVLPCYQGHWYYPLSIITCNMICATLGRGLLDHLRASRMFELLLPIRKWRIYPALLPILLGAGLCVIGTLALVGTHILQPVEIGRYGGARLALSGGLILCGFGTLLTAPIIADHVRAMARRHPMITADILPPITVIAALVIALLSANAFAHAKERDDYNGPYYRVWAGREKGGAALRKGYGGRGIIEFDDGILSYCLGMPAMSGYGLALDRDAYRARATGHLLDTAYARGFRALATVIYLEVGPACANPDTLRSLMGRFTALEGERIERWRFSMIARDTSTGVALIGFSPADEQPGPRTRAELRMR